MKKENEVNGNQVKIDVEQTLNPDNWIIQQNEEGEYFVSFLDEELDIIHCNIDDECITLNTEQLTYVVLSREHLEKMIDLIDEVENKTQTS